jgi:hypothetical protein
MIASTLYLRSMSLLLQGRLSHLSVNARVFFLGTVLEALLIPALWLASTFLGTRLFLFTALFTQGIVSMGLLYFRVRMIEIIRERHQGETIATVLRRAPI